MTKKTKSPFEVSAYQHLFLAQKCMYPECTKNAYVTHEESTPKILLCRDHDTKAGLKKAQKAVEQ